MKNPQDDKPSFREFWLWKTWGMPWTVHDKKPTYGDVLEICLHVIEYSAYRSEKNKVNEYEMREDLFRKEIEKLQRELRQKHIDISEGQGYCEELDRTNAALKSELERIKADLEDLAKNLPTYINDIKLIKEENQKLREALGEYKDIPIQKQIRTPSSKEDAQAGNPCFEPRYIAREALEGK